MKQLEVQIMGQNYLLSCPENGDARLLEAVERVDTAMCKIRDSGKVRARDRIAVLAALNLAFDLASQGTTPVPASATASVQESVTDATNSKSADSDLLLASLLERLNVALGNDGSLT